MVGSGRRPSKSFPVKYLVQDRAWLDRATFAGWYSTVFAPFVRERTSKPVLLVVDGQRPGHQGDFEEDGIRLVFLPPPVESEAAPHADTAQMPTVDAKTWWSRPLQMGVVAALKAEFKYLLVQSALSYYNAPQEVKDALAAAEKSGKSSGGVHFGHSPTLLDAARLLELAWSQIPADLLENCFARANLVPPSKLLAAPTPPGARQEQQELARLHCEDIASKIEGMLMSSSFLARTWTVAGEQNLSTNVRDRVRAFMQLDDDSSVELQQLLQREITEALNDVAPLRLTRDPGAWPADMEANSTRANETDRTSETRPDLTLKVRELLLGITDIASQLRLLPQSEADVEKLLPLQLEGCIAAADQIRHCIQTFDETLRSEGS
ncbi:unnamed protein product [Phytophthora fragariaefolia]|uniref:Unnamed protein product n=1 Tax=Phytophthora fragariaefolia TaxID=1490495 RepID=A0A9W6Y524_9STRA|nr:unnamed protein product [Phytophthora fragariaefolia]